MNSKAININQYFKASYVYVVHGDQVNYRLRDSWNFFNHDNAV